MKPLFEDILKFLEAQTTPVSIHDVIVALPKYEFYDIKVELWDLAANGLVKFDWDWKVTRSNDGPATY